MGFGSVLNKLREIHAEEIRPYLAARDRKPLARQLREASGLFWRYRYPPYQYLKAGLYLKSAPEPIDAYMPPRLIRYLQERMNPADARPLAKDKQLFRQRMEAAGLPVLREVLTVDRDGVIRDAEGTILERDAAALLLQEGEFFAKPTDGTYGRGARVLRPGDDIAAFLAGARNTIVQPRIRQHPLLQRLYPHAVNTVRIDTTRIDGRWVNNAAVLKLGVGGSIVDNGSAGGLIVGIDLDSGKLRPSGRQRMKFGDRLYSHHPETRVAFDGQTLPHWTLLRETVARAAEAALPLESLGWDVVITETGVVLLEANDKWCANLFQAGWGGLGDTPVGKLSNQYSRKFSKSSDKKI